MQADGFHVIEKLFNFWSSSSKKLFQMDVCVLPQQLEKLGVLPIKLWGGLGQPPETLDQVPRGSAYRFHS